MAEESGQTSIAARIAALKIDQVGRGGPPPRIQRNGAAEAKQPPVTSQRPELQNRPQSTNVPAVNSHGSTISNTELCNEPADSTINGLPPKRVDSAAPVMPNRPTRSAAPALPPRKPSGPAPQLPPRRPSEMSLEAPARPDYATNRRTSTSSTASALSTKSSMSRLSTRTGTSVGTASSGPLYTIKAPEFDAAKLPPLPPRREKSETQAPRAPLKSNNSSPSVLPATSEQAPVPKRIVSAPGLTPRPAQPARPKQSILTMGFNNAAPKPVNPTSLSDSAPTAANGAPPPIPTASRPDLTQLQASKPKLSGPPAAIQPQNSCLKCRDFSAVDVHAARFPRQSIPSTDLGWLAHQLTDPFPSLTDKARAIFTWLHHNVDYDVVAFFNNAVKPSTPASTLSTGLAVCEGYAGLFAALAVKCGLECVVVTGHGRGYGFSYTPGAPVPAVNYNHAWNAVRIDNGQWKLVDSCWGAGSIGGKGEPYKRGFSPEHFTRDNEDFGRSHYPRDQRYLYRSDGQTSIPWEEYILGLTRGELPPQMFNGYTSEEGIAVESFQPLTKKLSVRDSVPYVRFQFQKVCRHWDNERHGKGKHYVYFAEIGGVDGRATRKVPFETNGMFWWADVPPRELGAPGQEVKILAVTSFDKRDGRGVTPAEFKEKDGRVAWAGGFVAKYELV